MNTEVQRLWLTTVSGDGSGSVLIEGRAAKLTSTGDGEVRLSRLLDTRQARGKRLHLRARIRADSASISAGLSIRVRTAAPDDHEQIKDMRGGSVASTQIASLVDVPADSSQLELSLLVSGRGSAWFESVEVEVVGPAPSLEPIALTPQQLENLVALARASALIRYQHPSDQSADLDWNAFLPAAVERVMHSRTKHELVSDLRGIFAPIAPTVEISEAAQSTLTLPHMPAASHLSRWLHIALGSAPRVTNWREGRDPEKASVSYEVPIDVPALSRCQHPRLAAKGRRLNSDGSAFVYAEVEQQGQSSKRITLQLEEHESESMVTFDLPPDAYSVRLGTYVSGRTGIELSSISFACDNRDRVIVHAGQVSWMTQGATSLFSYGVRECGSSTCSVIQRQAPETSFVPERDVVETEIADHVWIRVPLAVWTDGRRTFPEAGAPAPSRLYATADVQVRLAAIMSAWGTLSLFYPYFHDQGIDWSRELPRSLIAAAAASSLAGIYQALDRLLAAIRDNHARVSHPQYPIDGVLPIALRRFGKTLVVVGALAPYVERTPVGAEVLAIGGVPALQAYDQAAARTSSATAGWADVMVPFRLTIGPIGTLVTVRIATPTGEVRELLLPRLPRDVYDSLVREPRPAYGAELAPGTYYIDLEAMKLDSWTSVLPLLTRARVVLLDMRGYPSNAVFDILGHFCDRELRSPEWQIPIVGTDGYKRSSWGIRPRLPRLGARVIVLLDGRASSAAETVLQILRDNHIGTFIGEPSAGTNGSTSTTPLPGGFSMRFTSMRVSLADGKALQGTGIAPDRIVHPTLAGVIAGRDEILEAALQIARQP